MHGGDSFVFVLLREDIGEEDGMGRISHQIVETLEKTGIKFHIVVSDFPENYYPLLDAEKKLNIIRNESIKC